MGRAKLLWAALACVAAGTLAAGAGEQSWIGVEAKLWRPKIDTQVKSSTDALAGTTVDLEDDLDLDSRDAVPFVKVSLGGSQRLSASFMRLSLDGKATPDINISFGGTTFTTAAEADATLDADIYRVAWEADWIRLPRVRAGTIFGVEVLDVTASIKNPLVGKEEEDVTAPVPVVGLQGEVKLLAGLSAYGEIAGMAVNHGDIDGSFYEYEAGLKYTLGSMIPGRLSAAAGWRQIHLDFEDDDNEAEIDLGGFIVGVGFNF